MPELWEVDGAAKVRALRADGRARRAQTPAGVRAGRVAPRRGAVASATPGTASALEAERRTQLAGARQPRRSSSTTRDGWALFSLVGDGARRRASRGSRASAPCARRAASCRASVADVPRQGLLPRRPHRRPVHRRRALVRPRAPAARRAPTSASPRHAAHEPARRSRRRRAHERPLQAQARSGASRDLRRATTSSSSAAAHTASRRPTSCRQARHHERRRAREELHRRRRLGPQHDDPARQLQDARGHRVLRREPQDLPAALAGARLQPAALDARPPHARALRALGRACSASAPRPTS